MTNQFKLTVLNENNLLQIYPISSNQVAVSIGREPGNDLVINHPQVSRRHARLSYDGQHWWLENLSQSSPAKYGGTIVAAPIALKPNDIIQLSPAISMQFVAEGQNNAFADGGSNAYQLNQASNQSQMAQVRVNTAANGAYNPSIVKNNVATSAQSAIQSPEEGSGTMFLDRQPPILSISYTENFQEVAKDFVLTKPQISIGRVPENDIVIPIATVSRHHALLTQGPSGYTISDQNSSNGLLYKGGKIQERLLTDGDVIRIGDQMGNVATLVYHDHSRPAIGQVFALKLDPNVALITIGRASDNSMVLNHPQVSTHHAQIRREANGIVIQDLGSTNGTFVRGERLAKRGSAPLNIGDTIQIATYQLVYQPDGVAQKDSNHVRIDAIRVTKTVNNNSLVLLNDISLTIRPKEFVALVGGSGAGKSTLMDALNGFRPATQGIVLLNGDDYYQNFELYRNNLGYVPQDDIIHRELTVERALYYVARLRLPQDTSEAEIKQRVTEVLEDVDMTGRRGLVVSRLSGGQRKRVSIAVELLAKPNLLFLDEPTSGLDPGLDKRMMFLLRRLADQGRTIVLVTHATTNITSCDKVAFLAAGGRLVFFGPPGEALEFFQVKEFPDIYSKLEQTPTSGEEWQTRFQQSPYFQKYIVEQQQHLPAPAHPPMQYTPPPNPQVARAAERHQFFILTRRYAELVVRDRVNLLVLLLQAPIIAIILAVVAGSHIFESNPGHPPFGAQQVLFMLAVSGVWLGTNNAAREITKENPIYMRERLVNLRVFPYVMSKVVVLAVLCLVQSVLLVGIVVVAAGAPPHGVFFPAVLELIFSVWLTALAGMGMGLLVSAIASNTDKAVSIVPIILIPQIILSGVIFSLPGATQNLSYLTVTKWSLDSLGTTGDMAQLFFESGVPTSETNCAPDGKTFDPRNYADNPCEVQDKLDEFGNPTPQFGQRSFHLLVRWFFLVLMIVIYLGATCYLQKRKDLARQRR